MKWTDEQKKVIEARDRNLLVSAAAGSGKTAVLIERIMELVLDPQKPIDIDRLLIVTFTKAAAQEMRDRLYKEIQERAEEDPDNLHLRRQLQLVLRAQVCTIDSFCSNLVKNYAHELDMDPAFRVGDNTEIELLMSDTVNELLEECYAEGDKAFLDFTEALATGKKDNVLGDLVIRLYNFSESAPWPEEWLKGCEESYQLDSPESVEKTPWCSFCLEQMKALLEGYIKEYQDLISLCEVPGGPYPYAAACEDNIEAITKACEYENYAEAQALLGGLKLKNKPIVKDASVEEDLKERLGKRYSNLNKAVKSICTRFERPQEEIFDQLQKIKPLVGELVHLTLRFREKFAAAKKKKGVLSFGDLEHFSLDILYKDGERSEIAKQLSHQFEEIMIDEYQDSNEVQETLLRAISREEEGRPNIFMVGDMKQSIYRFRMARPELFVSKYKSYTDEPSEHQKIELHKNFRSRKEVVDGVNFFFEELMQDRVGGIEYDESAKLNFGAEFKETEEKIAGIPEILLLDDGISEEDDAEPEEGEEKDGTSEENPSEENQAEDWTNQELEAEMIAAEIRKLMDPGDPMMIFDPEKGYRKIRYSDIVILLRTARNWDAPFQEVFENHGIPAYVESKDGYFEAWEVRLMLNLLSCIDNPIQDIPLVSVMRSPLFRFKENDLGRIKAGYLKKIEGNGFFGALNAYHENDELQERIQAFLAFLEKYRKASTQESLSMLIREIYADTGFLPFVTAMPGGARRTANLQALLGKAEAFEKTSYHGIFHFIRYIEKLKKYSSDEGEASTAGENDDTVRIMTIHKSKGLEFPVVFVSGCGKQFNKSDENDAVILHQDLGVGIREIDVENRTRRSSMVKEAIRAKMETENLGEELRVLYVAMTRAKEKLYLTGYIGDFEKNREEYEARWEKKPEPLSYLELTKSKSFFEWILKAYRYSAPVGLRILTKEELQLEAEEANERFLKEEALQTAFSDQTDTEDLYHTLETALSAEYHYDDLYKAYATMSVSALKAAWLEKREEQETSEAIVKDLPTKEKALPRPDFMCKDEVQVIGGAERGTLYHAVMEHIDPHLRSVEEVHEALQEMENAGLISSLEKDTINPWKIVKFLQSSIAERFMKAFDGKAGYRERQFIIGVPLKETMPGLDLKKHEDELLMIQGIIDMYFEEDDGLVLVDYKTDAVKTAAELVSKYSIQLDYYQQALEQATKKKVKEKWIYSFTLDEEIRL